MHPRLRSGAGERRGHARGHRGLPWSLSLLTLGLSPGVAHTALLMLTGSWAVNAALLWWLALRRPGHHSPSHPA